MDHDIWEYLKIAGWIVTASVIGWQSKVIRQYREKERIAEQEARAVAALRITGIAFGLMLLPSMAMAQANIVGWWHYARNQHILDLWKFRSDGTTVWGECFRTAYQRSCMTRPVIQGLGRYVIQGNAMTMTFPEGRLEVTFRVERPDPADPARRLTWLARPNRTEVMFEMMQPPAGWGGQKCPQLPCEN